MRFPPLPAPPDIPTHLKPCPFFSLFRKQTGKMKEQTNKKLICTQTYKNIKLGTTLYKQKNDKTKNAS